MSASVFVKRSGDEWDCEKVREKFRVVFAGRSVQDLEDIAAYLAERSGDPWVGELWLDSMLEHVERLEQFPFGYPEFCVAPYWKLIHGRYLVIFRIDGQVQRGSRGAGYPWHAPGRECRST